MEREKEGILLESGTNEIEIMKFTIQGEFYGINVAKVKEITGGDSLDANIQLVFHNAKVAAQTAVAYSKL